jgi:hypothetical protein
MFVASVIDRSKAENLLSKTNRLWSSRKKMIKVEIFCLPVYLFTIKLEDNKGRELTDLVSVDGIKGEFAFFKEPDYEGSLFDIKDKFEFILAEKKAREIAMQEYQRFLFKNNLKTRNDVKIIELNPGRQIYYPYWIGYFKRKNGYDFEVIDAVSGSIQGMKMRPVFIDLLLQNSNNH